MKRTIAALTFALVLGLGALPAWASCTYHSYFINGRYVSCSTCCFGNQCTTTCF
jgi:hypothetical protein